jgi:hypothetical protein
MGFFLLRIERERVTQDPYAWLSDIDSTIGGCDSIAFVAGTLLEDCDDMTVSLCH